MCRTGSGIRTGIRRATCGSRVPQSAPRHSSYPVFRMPGRDAVDRHRQRAPQLHQVSGGLLVRWVVGRRDLVQHGEASQQLDLQEVDRIDIGVAHVDRAPEHRVVLEQSVVAAHQQHAVDRLLQPGPQARRRNPADPAARAVDRSAQRSRARPSRAPSAVDRARSEERPRAGTSRGTCRDRPRRASGSPPPQPRREQQSRLRPRELPRDRAQRSNPVRRRLAAPAGCRCAARRAPRPAWRRGSRSGSADHRRRSAGTRGWRLRRDDPWSRASAGRARDGRPSAASSVAVV